MAGYRRVLFFAEAVTLAHLARPIALASALRAEDHEVIFACHPRCERFLQGVDWQRWPIQSIPAEQFTHALAKGDPVYDLPTLQRYVKDDLAIIDRVNPDLVVGDFRLSLSVSARLAGVPYATITNAYWSPHHRLARFPLPVLPLTRALPLPLAEALFYIGRPVAFALHCRPMNALRRAHGLTSLGSNLRRVYTDADFVLYADAPFMFPLEHVPVGHHFLGPILWSPPGDLPAWWADLNVERPIVYVTLGSSGAAQLLQLVLDALADLPVCVVAATASGRAPARVPANAFISDYVPGTELAARSALVVCNGGSPTSQQALAAGVPVLGLAGNMDQFLNMGAIVTSGAGRMLRADRLTSKQVQVEVQALLQSLTARQRARELKADLGRFNAPKRFTEFAAGELLQN